MFVILLVTAIAGFAAASPVPRAEGTAKDMDGRVMGGEVVSIKDFPYQVAMLMNDRLRCGGSIIGKNHVLTAAHCFTMLTPEDLESITIRVGSNTTNFGGSVHRLANVAINSRYADEDESIMGDLAVIRVEPEIQFDETRQPIEIFSPEDELKEGSLATITGYGRLYSAGPLSSTLMAVTVPVTNRAVCREIYDSLALVVAQDSFCAGYPDGGKDSCQGDSGGPVAIDGRQAGISSWGWSCGEPITPGVYTDIAYHNAWIQEQIRTI